MDLNFTPEHDAFRAEAREWLAANVPAEPLKTYDTEEGFQQHREWEAKMNEGRWGMVTWPTELGGRDADLIQWLIFEEEYFRAKAPSRVNQNGIFLLGPTLMEYGTEEQKAEILPKMADGTEVWAQGWSEPNAGSDMAAVRAKAELTEDGEYYIINGQKTWSTRAVWADQCFGMFRTDPESKRHKGLTFILVPLDLEGITVNPIPQLDGLPGFAEIFFDNVKVPVNRRLGDEGQGWEVAMATAGFERGLMLRSPARFQETAKRLVELYKENQATADEDPAIRDAVIKAYMSAESYCITTFETACRLIKGGKIGAESSTNKIFWSELDQDMHATAMDILAARAELEPFAPQAKGVGTWLDGFLFAQSGPIYAGTNEIQRNIIAERMLGMPRK
ncbi:MAG: acyl-CoA dehydrogenase family protein [Pseudomonadales bacterium]|nr:acyl-CoA dehydrogenase family protein [Pseudomonadales bacterium]